MRDWPFVLRDAASVPATDVTAADVVVGGESDREPAEPVRRGALIVLIGGLRSCGDVGVQTDQRNRMLWGGLGSLISYAVERGVFFGRCNRMLMTVVKACLSYRF